MAWIAMREKRKQRLRPLPDEDIVVRSLSVPPGLENLMESLTREVLRLQPRDIYMFATEHFTKLCTMRDCGKHENNFNKTAVRNKQSISSPPPKKTPVENTSGVKLAVPQLELLNIKTSSPDIKLTRSEASTAEIDKVEELIFEMKGETAEKDETVFDHQTPSANEMKITDKENDDLLIVNDVTSPKSAIEFYGESNEDDKMETDEILSTNSDNKMVEDIAKSDLCEDERVIRQDQKDVNTASRTSFIDIGFQEVPNDNTNVELLGNLDVETEQREMTDDISTEEMIGTDKINADNEPDRVNLLEDFKSRDDHIELKKEQTESDDIIPEIKEINISDTNNEENQPKTIELETETNKNKNIEDTSDENIEADKHTIKKRSTTLGDSYEEVNDTDENETLDQIVPQMTKIDVIISEEKTTTENGQDINNKNTEFESVHSENDIKTSKQENIDATSTELSIEKDTDQELVVESLKETEEEPKGDVASPDVLHAMSDMVQATRAALQIQSCWRSYLKKKATRPAAEGETTMPDVTSDDTMLDLVRITRAALKIQLCWRAHSKRFKLKNYDETKLGKSIENVDEMTVQSKQELNDEVVEREPVCETVEKNVISETENELKPKQYDEDSTIRMDENTELCDSQADKMEASTNVEKSEDITEKSERITKKVEELIEKEEETTETEEKILEKSEELIEKETDVDEKSEKNTEKAEELIEKTEEITELAEEIYEKSEELLEKAVDSEKIIEAAKEVCEKSEELIEKEIDVAEKSEEITEKAEELIEKEEDITETEEQVSEESEELVEKKVDATEKTEEIIEKNKELIDKEEKMIETAEEISSEELIGNNADSAKKLEDITEKVEELIKKEEEITEEVGKISEKAEELIQKEDDAIENEITEKLDTNTEHSIEISEQSEGLSKTVEKLIEKDDEITEKAEEISERVEELIKKEDVTEIRDGITEKSDELTEKFEEITEKSVEIIEKKEEVNETSEEIFEKTEELIEKTTDVTEKLEKMTEKVNESIEIEADLTEKSKEIIKKAQELIEKEDIFVKVEQLTEKSEEISEKVEELIENSDEITEKSEVITENDEDIERKYINETLNEQILNREKCEEVHNVEENVCTEAKESENINSPINDLEYQRNSNIGDEKINNELESQEIISNNTEVKENLSNENENILVNNEKENTESNEESVNDIPISSGDIETAKQEEPIDINSEDNEEEKERKTFSEMTTDAGNEHETIENKSTNNADEESSVDTIRALNETNDEHTNEDVSDEKHMPDETDLPHKLIEGEILTCAQMIENLEHVVQESRQILESTESTDEREGSYTRKSSLENSVTEDFTTMKKLIDQINTSSEIKSDEIFDGSDPEINESANKTAATSLEAFPESRGDRARGPETAGDAIKDKSETLEALTSIDSKIDDIDDQIKNTLMDILERPVTFAQDEAIPGNGVDNGTANKSLPDDVPGFVNETSALETDRGSRAQQTDIAEVERPQNNSQGSDKTEYLLNEEHEALDNDTNSDAENVELHHDLKKLEFTLDEHGCSLETIENDRNLIPQDDAAEEKLNATSRQLEGPEPIECVNQLDASAITIQRIVRGFLARCRLKRDVNIEVIKAALTIQRVARGYLARKRLQENVPVPTVDALTKAAMTIQRGARGYLARKRANLSALTRAAVTIQRVTRGYLARKRLARQTHFDDLTKATITIQKYARAYLARKETRIKDINNLANAAIVIQKFIRGYLTRKRMSNAGSIQNTSTEETDCESPPPKDIEHLNERLAKISQEIENVEETVEKIKSDVLRPSARDEDADVEELNKRLAAISTQSAPEGTPVKSVTPDTDEDIENLKHRLATFKKTESGDSMTTVQSAEYVIEEEEEENEEIKELNKRLALIEKELEAINNTPTEEPDNEPTDTEEIIELNRRLSQIYRDVPSESNASFVVPLEEENDKNDNEEIVELNRRLSQIKPIDIDSKAESIRTVASPEQDSSEILELNMRLSDLTHESALTEDTISEPVEIPDQDDNPEIGELNRRLSLIKANTVSLDKRPDTAVIQEETDTEDSDVINLDKRLSQIKVDCLSPNTTQEMKSESESPVPEQDDLNKRLSRLNRSYSMRVSSDDSADVTYGTDVPNPDGAVESTKQELTVDPVISDMCFSEVNYSSPKYDLKRSTPRSSKNTSPSHIAELTTAAYVISAGIAAPADEIISVMNPEEVEEERIVEYIHIPLKSDVVPFQLDKIPLGNAPDSVTSQRPSAKPKQQLVKTRKSDGSVEYIYIPLKEPGGVDLEEILDAESVEIRSSEKEFKADTPQSRKALYDEIDAIIETYDKSPSPKLGNQNRDLNKSPVVFETSFNTKAPKISVDSDPKDIEVQSDVPVEQPGTKDTGSSDMAEFIETLTDLDGDVAFNRDLNVNVPDEVLDEMAKPEHAPAPDTRTVDEFVQELTDGDDGKVLFSGVHGDATGASRNVEQGRDSGLGHTGEMHDSVEIFLSGEELSQGQVYVIIVSPQ